MVTMSNINGLQIKRVAWHGSYIVYVDFKPSFFLMSAVGGFFSVYITCYRNTLMSRIELEFNFQN